MNLHNDTNCLETMLQISALDDELDLLSCPQIEAHLETCTACQVVYNTLKKTVQLCQSNSEGITLPAEIRSRLLYSLSL